MSNTAEERLTTSIENLEPSKYEQLLKMAIDRARLTGQIEGATAGWRECVKFLRRLSEDSDIETQELLLLAEQYMQRWAGQMTPKAEAKRQPKSKARPEPVPSFKLATD